MKGVRYKNECNNENAKQIIIIIIVMKIVMQLIMKTIIIIIKMIGIKSIHNNIN